MANFIPKYEPLVPAMIAMIRHGSEIERKAAEADRLNLARLADKYIEQCQDAAKARAQPSVDDIMSRLTDKKDKDGSAQA
jgi:hypothetical protein